MIKGPKAATFTNRRKLAFTSAMAATLVALPSCSPRNEWDDDMIADRDTRVCVDQNGNRVDDDGCTQGSSRFGGGMGWFYIGRGGRLPYFGDNVRTQGSRFVGSAQPSAGTSYADAPAGSRMTRSAAVSRGGFGSSGRSFGGGRS